jgi:hypothetical protein
MHSNILLLFFFENQPPLLLTFNYNVYNVLKSLIMTCYSNPIDNLRQKHPIRPHSRTSSQKGNPWKRLAHYTAILAAREKDGPFHGLEHTARASPTPRSVGTDRTGRIAASHTTPVTSSQYPARKQHLVPHEAPPQKKPFFKGTQKTPHRFNHGPAQKALASH